MSQDITSSTPKAEAPAAVHTDGAPQPHPTAQPPAPVVKRRARGRWAWSLAILPVLADVIARSPTGDLTYLVTEYGKAFTAAGFGNWFRERCDDAGLPHCSAHGLRKAGATIAAENGATDRQLMALYDWTSEKQANVYTAAANRKRLAGQAAQLLARDQSANTEVSHLSVPPEKSGDRSTG